MDAIAAHEHQLTAYALERLKEIPGLSVYGPAAEHKGGVISFTMEGIHPHDVAALLDRDGIAVRAGHHCAMPLHQKLEPARHHAGQLLPVQHHRGGGPARRWPAQSAEDVRIDFSLLKIFR